MPIYAYRCASCGAEKDILQKLSDAPLTQCPACGDHALRKQVTAAGFQLKGSGWYVTDFRNGAQRAPSPANNDAAPAANAERAAADNGHGETSARTAAADSATSAAPSASASTSNATSNTAAAAASSSGGAA